MPNPNAVLQVQRVYVSNVPAAPGAGATIVLFSTHGGSPGGVAATPSVFYRASGTQPVIVTADALEKLELTFHLHDKASAANGLRAYETKNGGATWIETDMKGYVMGFPNLPSIGAGAPIQVPVLAAGQEWSEEFDIGRYRGFAVTYTAGAAGPTPVTGWDVSISANFCPQED